MKFSLNAYPIWEVGQRTDRNGNPHQEDSIFPEFSHITDSDRLFVLCDGMGGHAAGEVASSTVCKSIAKFIIANCPNPATYCPKSVILDAIDAAFDTLDAVNSPSTRGMGTTLTLLKLHSRGATIAHIGDSRVYHIRPGQTPDQTIILHQTQDHSLVNELVRNGKITPEEAHTFPQKNVIMRAMQPNLDPRPHADIYTTNDIRPGDFFYLCSDGMLEQQDMDLGPGIQHAFSSQFQSDTDRVNFLRTATAHNRDNHSAIIVHILDVITDDTDTATPQQQPQVEQPITLPPAFTPAAPQSTVPTFTHATPAPAVEAPAVETPVAQTTVPEAAVTSYIPSDPQPNPRLKLRKDTKKPRQATANDFFDAVANFLQHLGIKNLRLGALLLAIAAILFIILIILICAYI